MKELKQNLESYGTEHFKTNVGIKNIIGRDLINSDNIAILELVKNSFDALATEVFIDFENLTEGIGNNVQSVIQNNAEIIIRDNGHGMEKNDIKNKWLNIAYSEKKEEKNKDGRLMAGAKGVGRFSCDRLGEELNIYTKTKKSNTVSHLYINWKDFDSNNINFKIEDVKIKLGEISTEELIKKFKINDFTQGTIIQIAKLRSPWIHYKPLKKEWDDTKIKKLKLDLEKLINPNQQFSKTPFYIELNVEKNETLFQQLNGEVKNTIFNDLDFKVTSIVSEVSEDGLTIETHLKDKGRNIVSFSEQNVLNEYLAGTKMTLYYMSTYSKIYFAKETGTRLVNFGSLYLFINGFRVSPYGEEGDDWLGLEKRKGQGYARYLGTREILGRIEVLDDKGNLKIVSSREGIVDNKYFSSLKKFALLTHSRLEKYVVNGIGWDTIKGNTKEERDLRLKEFEKLAENSTIEELEKKEEFLANEKDIIKNLEEVIFQVLKTNGSGSIKDVIIDERIAKNVIDESNNEQDKFINKLKKISLKDGHNQLLTKLLENEKVVKTLEKKQIEKDLKIKILEEQNKDKEDNLKSAKKEILENKEVIHHKDNIIKEKDKNIKLVEKDLIKEKKKGVFQGALISTDKERVIGMQHQILHSSSRINRNIKLLLNHFDKNLDPKLQKYIKTISLEASKINSIANFVTKANFNLTASKIKTGLIDFIKDYINEIYLIDDNIIDTSINIQFQDDVKQDLVMEFIPLELTTIIDIFISNAEKSKATEMKFNFGMINNKLQIQIIDNGYGISSENIGKIFDLGYTTTKGSGIGLFQAKDMIENGLNGDISISSEGNGKGITINILI